MLTESLLTISIDPKVEPSKKGSRYKDERNDVALIKNWPSESVLWSVGDDKAEQPQRILQGGSCYAHVHVDV